MINKDDILNALNNDIETLEIKIKERETNSVKHNLLTALLKAGVALDYCIPFILSTFIMLFIFLYNNDFEFKIGEVREYASVKTIVTSSGYEENSISYDVEYSGSDVEYTTAWKINDYGLYERDVILYRITGDIEEDDILNMSFEDLAKKYVITNQIKIQKLNLSEKDKIYDEDMIILTKIVKDENYSIVRSKNELEYLLQLLLYALLTFAMGCGINNLKRMVIKEGISTKLGVMILKYRPIKKFELEEAKEILKLKKENMDLLTEDKIKKR